MPMNGMRIKKQAPCLVMKIKINIQRATKTTALPSSPHIRKWVKTALAGHVDHAELTIRMVGAKEAARLNWQWRRKKGPTNVLSFPATGMQNFAPGLLGDIVLCAPVIAREATQQGKSPDAHWAHMVIHGTLHLLGYDHKKPAETRKMENLEVKLLATMDIAAPYQ